MSQISRSEKGENYAKTYSIWEKMIARQETWESTSAKQVASGLGL